MGRINSYNIISAANTNPTDKLVIETSNGTKAINISDLSATIWASLTNKDSVPTNGSTNLITSGAVFTALGNKLGFGGNLNSAQELTKSQFDDLILTNDTVYKILFAEDFFYEDSQSRYGYVIQFNSLLRLIYNPYEGLFYCTKTLNNYTEWTNCISSFGSGSIQDGSINYNKLASDVHALLNNKLDKFIDTSTLVTAAMLSTSAYQNQKYYYIRLAADVLFSGQSAGIGIHLININQTQYVLTDGYGIYYRQGTNSNWSNLINKDSVPTNGSTNLITSGAVFTALENTVGTLNTTLENALNGTSS